MKIHYLTYILAVILFMASCKSENKPVVSDQPETKEIVDAVNKGNLNFYSYFLDKTMRLDYFHSGTAIEDRLRML